jgi:hypothetical protein
MNQQIAIMHDKEARQKTRADAEDAARGVTSADEVGRMRQRVGAFDAVARADQGGLNRRASDPRNGDSGGSDIVSPGVTAMMREYDQSSISTREIFQDAMRVFREWTEDENPFEEGYRKRLLILLLGPIYKLNITAEAWALKFLDDHALNDCAFARKVIVSTLAALDDIFLKDKVPNAINMISSEYLAKEGCAGVQAFLPVKRVDDWRRPRNANQQQSWSTKVDWDTYERLNPRAKESSMRQHRDIEEDLRKGRAHDMAILTVQDKMKSAASDQINGS